MTKRTVTPAREWRRAREEGYEITLPSGNIAKLRPVAMDALLASGEIPDLLTPFVVEMLFEGFDQDKMQEALSPEKMVRQASEMMQLFNVICRASFVSPRIVDSPEADDEISIEDVEPEDRSAVFALAIQPARVMRNFRDKQGADVAPVPNVDGDGAEAEPVDEDSGPVDSVPA